MTYHGGPRDTLRNAITRAKTKADSRINHYRHLAVRQRKKFPKNPEAYEAVCKFNAKHGISAKLYRETVDTPTRRNLRKLIALDKSAITINAKGVRRKQRPNKITLPKITMPTPTD